MQLFELLEMYVNKSFIRGAVFASCSIFGLALFMGIYNCKSIELITYEPDKKTRIFHNTWFKKQTD